MLIITDFPPTERGENDVEDGDEETEGKKHGISTSNVAYEDTKPQLEKGKRLFHSDMKGICQICEEKLKHNEGLHTICPNPDCDTITHMTCLSQHFLEGEKNKQSDEHLVPIKGLCPGCKTEIRWSDVVKELSLRIRGQTLVEKLLKPKRVKKGKDVAASQAVVESEDDDVDEEEEDYINMGEIEPQTLGEEEGNEFENYFDSDDSDALSIISLTSNGSKKPKKTSGPKTKSRRITVIEDSDIDEGEESYA